MSKESLVSKRLREMEQSNIAVVSGSVRIQMPLEYAETLHGLIDGVIGSCDDDELARQLTTILKKLDKQIKNHYR